MLMILFQQETAGLYAWGSGTLGQAGLEAAARVTPVVLVAVATLMLLARRLDLLALGDDAASVLGLNVRRTRMTTCSWRSCSAPPRSRWPGRSGSSASPHRSSCGSSDAGSRSCCGTAGCCPRRWSPGRRRGRFGRAAADRVRPDGRRDRPDRRAHLDPRGRPAGRLARGYRRRQRVPRPVARHQGRDTAPGRRDPGGDRRAARRCGGRGDAPRRHQRPPRRHHQLAGPPHRAGPHLRPGRAAPAGAGCARRGSRPRRRGGRRPGGLPEPPRRAGSRRRHRRRRVRRGLCRDAGSRWPGPGS